MKNAYRDFPIAIFASVCSGSKGLMTLLESFEEPNSFLLPMNLMTVVQMMLLSVQDKIMG